MDWEFWIKLLVGGFFFYQFFLYIRSKEELARSIAEEQEQEDARLDLVKQNGKKMPVEMCLDVLEEAYLSYFPQTGHVTVLPRTGKMAIIYAKEALRYCEENQIDLDARLDERERRLKTES